MTFVTRITLSHNKLKGELVPKIISCQTERGSTKTACFDVTNTNATEGMFIHDNFCLRFIFIQWFHRASRTWSTWKFWTSRTTSWRNCPSRCRRCPSCASWTVRSIGWTRSRVGLGRFPCWRCSICLTIIWARRCFLGTSSWWVGIVTFVFKSYYKIHLYFRFFEGVVSGRQWFWIFASGDQEFEESANREYTFCLKSAH